VVVVVTSTVVVVAGTVVVVGTGSVVVVVDDVLRVVEDVEGTPVSPPQAATNRPIVVKRTAKTLLMTVRRSATQIWVTDSLVSLRNVPT